MKMNMSDNGHHSLIDGLIKACRRNDRRAQIDLYNCFSKTMYNTSFRIVHDSFLAEDIVQESFLKAFQSLEQFRGEVPFEAWLRRIVINRSIDQLRLRKIQWEELTERIADKEEEIDEDKDEFEYKIEVVRKLIRELPDGFRVIISLYFLEGYDHEEIGQILNITSSTSRSQLTRAKRRLIELVKENQHVRHK
jgi:RNA polymerase sigma factor (sigma-70 family)